MKSDTFPWFSAGAGVMMEARLCKPHGGHAPPAGCLHAEASRDAAHQWSPIYVRRDEVPVAVLRAFKAS